MSVFYPGINDPPKVRQKRLRLDADMVLAMFRSFNGCRVPLVREEIPDDARVVRMEFGHPYGVIDLYVESETFPEGLSDWDLSFRTWSLERSPFIGE